MVTWILWAAGIGLESVILVRFLTQKLYKHYPLFFAYMLLVWTSNVVLLPIYRVSPSAYTNPFWLFQFLTLLAGFGVMIEIVRKSFENYPGAKGFISAILVVMFTILCAYFCYKVLLTSPIALDNNFADLERDFRALQAVVLSGALALIAYYRIEIGKNLKGIILGLGLYVGCTIVSHAVRGNVGPSFDHVWKMVQPYTYFVALLIWLVTLWSYAPPPPAPDAHSGFEQGYDGLARRTKERLRGIRVDVGRAEGQ